MANSSLKHFLKFIGWSLLLTLFIQSSMAQDARETLSLKEAIDSTLANNRSLQLADLDERIAASKFRETDAFFLPQLDFSYTAITTNNPLNAFGFKLQQQSVKQADFDPEFLNHPGNASNFMTQLQLKQPIFNMDMLYMRKAAASQTAVYKLKTERTKEYLTYEVEKAYMQLQLAYDAADVLEEALRTANALYAFTNNRVKEGLLQQSDALNVKVWITSVETNLAEAKSNIRNASDYLSLLMGKPYGIIYKAEKSSASTVIPAADAVPSNRADFAAMKKAIESSGLMIKSYRMNYVPKVNGFASYQYNDNRMLGFSNDSYLAGIQLSWNIFNGNSIKNKIATHRIEQSKLIEQLQGQQEQSQMELNKTARQLNDAQYKINQQNTAVENASEALRILEDRYEQGLINSTDVLMAQTQLSQQKLNLVQAVFSRNITAAYITFLTASSK